VILLESADVAVLQSRARVTEPVFRDGTGTSRDVVDDLAAVQQGMCFCGSGVIFQQSGQRITG